MKDYRLKENREEYFTALYKMNLEHGVMPGLVYLYMPELAKRYGWDTEQRLWFAFLNGNTQNPITSLRIMRRFPDLEFDLGHLQDWFDSNWDTLSFDTDRRYQKKELVRAVESYSNLAESAGSQEELLSGTFSELWEHVTNDFHSFGRLAAFSYLEYVRIMGAGADCDRLFLEDKSGSKSHRNGMFFLIGRDDLVWDKRQPGSHDGNYDNFKPMCNWLENRAREYLATSGVTHEHAGFFTFESQCCQFKNGFFGRRAPGIYADMAWERIKWYEDRGFTELTKVFKQIREDHLPEWLRIECENGKHSINDGRTKQFMLTGVPYRAEYFM